MLLQNRIPLFIANKGASDQTGITSATPTKITMTNELYDVGGYYDSANSKWTPPAGKVRVGMQSRGTGTLALRGLGAIYIYKNGAVFATEISANISTSSTETRSITKEDIANGTDYYEAWAYVTTTSGTATIKAEDASTLFWGHGFPS